MSARVSSFMLVGLAGFVVQIAALTWLTHRGWTYPAAVLVAVEAAVLHNFVWHERWTWRDRRHGSSVASRLIRFHGGTALTSFAGNLLVTVAGVELFGLHPATANAAAVVATSVANFLMADRWVFVHTTAAVALLLVGLQPQPALAAEPGADTLAAWAAHVARVEADLDRHSSDPPLDAPEGRTFGVPGGAIHEWRGSLVVRGITVASLVQALSDPGLPPPSEDVLEARVLSRQDDAWSVYMKLTRSAIVTVTYDTVHDVAFRRRSDSLVTSRSVATLIRESGGGDRGFLWRLNSYWRYRQVGDAVQIDVLSLSLSRSVPSVVRPIAGPIIKRVARESMARTLDAMRRFAAGLYATQLAGR